MTVSDIAGIDRISIANRERLGSRISASLNFFKPQTKRCLPFTDKSGITVNKGIGFVANLRDSSRTKVSFVSLTTLLLASNGEIVVIHLPISITIKKNGRLVLRILRWPSYLRKMPLFILPFEWTVLEEVVMFFIVLMGCV